MKRSTQPAPGYRPGFSGTRCPDSASHPSWWVILTAPASEGSLIALLDLMARSLEERGASERSALLCARIGMDAFSTAIRRWSTGSADLHVTVDETFDELRALAAQ